MQHSRPARIVQMAAALALVALSMVAFAQRKTTSRTESAQESSAQRGKYIVEGVARCGQCHTPRDDNGNPDASHWLQGAPVWLKSAEASQNWPLVAPRIAGTLPASDADMVTLLTTGIWSDGKYLRPPMPQFRLNQEDAKAVVTYLKSIPSSAR